MMRATAIVLSVLALGAPVLAAPAKAPVAKKPAAKTAAPAKVTVTGLGGARVKGAAVPLVFLGQIRHFDVVLDRVPNKTAVPPKKAMPSVRVRCETGTRGEFHLPAVPPGSYLLRIVMPGVPVGLNNAELYRASLDVRPGMAPLELRMPFLAMKVLEADGSALDWEMLRLQVKREGPALHQEWESGFAKKPGANPPGPLEEKGGIIVEIQSQNGEISVSYSWQSHDKSFILFPLVEEDGPVDYRLALNAPRHGSCTLRFDASRGKSPEEVVARLSPFGTVAGKVRLKDVDAPLGQVQVTASVYALDDRSTPLCTLRATPDADGSFSFDEVPRGAIWISAQVVTNAPGKPQLAYGASTGLELGGETPKPLDLLISPTSQQEAAARTQEFFRPRAARPIVQPQPGKSNGI